LVRILTPPVFTDNEKTQQAGLLYGVVPYAMFLEAFFLIGALTERNFTLRMFLIVGVGEISGLLSLWLVHKGSTRTATHLWIWSQWCVASISGFTGGMVNDPGFFFHMLIVIMAGWLLGIRWGTFTALLSIVLNGLQAYLRTSFPGVFPSFSYSPISLWLSVTIEILLALILVRASRKTLLRVLFRLIEELEERTRAEQAARESEASFRSLAENASDAIFILCGVDPRFVFANRRVEALTGYSPEELVGLSLGDLIQAPYIDTVMKNYQARVRGTGVIEQYETVVQHRSMGEIPVELSAALIQWHGQPASFIIARDASARKARETQILDENARLEVVNRLSVALREFTHINDAGRLILNQVMDLLGMASGLVLTRDEVRIEVISSSSPGMADVLQGFPDHVLMASGSEKSIQVISIQDEQSNSEDWLGWASRQASPFQSIVVLPLRIYEMTTGFLVLLDAGPVEVSPAMRALLSQVAEIAAITLERMRIQTTLEQRVADRTHDLSILYRVMTVANQPLEKEEMLSQVLSIALEAIRASTGWIQLVAAEPEIVQLGGKDPAEVRRLMDLVKGSLFEEEILTRGKPRIVSGLPIAWNQTLEEEGWPGDLIGIPLQSSGTALGIFWGYKDEAVSLTLEDIALLVSIGERIGTALETLHLNENLRRLAVLEERHRLARDLHDSVTQDIYSLMLFAGDAKRSARSGNADQTEMSLKRVEEIARLSLKELRLMIYELRPPELQQVGLVKALRNRLEAVEKRTGIQVRFSSAGELQISSQAEEHLYWIAIEALNNSLKYAGASQLVLKISTLDEGVEMEISDNGCGFDPGQIQSGGNGLRGMSERAAALGAALEIDSLPGQGVRIHIRVER
jgi:PAS domain S-box-containing protein